MFEALTRLADRIYDRLNNTETARAWDNGRCIAVMRLPKGYCDSIAELTKLLQDHSPDEIDFFEYYED